MAQCSGVTEIRNESAANQIELNHRCLVKIVETLQFLARQGLALRGDNSDDDSNLIQNPKTSCERHPAINGLDETKVKQIYEPRYSKRNNSNYGKSNNLGYNS